LDFCLSILETTHLPLQRSCLSYILL
jgi:hypothetical protein